MPEYVYRAIAASGRELSGVIAAPGREAAWRTLSERGLTAYSVEPSTGAGSGSNDRPFAWLVRLGGNADREDFAKGLAMLLEAGVPTEDALRILSSHSTAADRVRIDNILDGILDGEALSVAIARSGAGLPPFFVPMVRAGEASGRVAEVLSELAQTMERMREVRSKIRSALIYPFILLVLASVVIAILFGVLFPTLAPLFEGSGAPLPTALRLAVWVEETIASSWPAMAVAGLALALGAMRLSRQPKTRELKDRLLLALPVIGPLLAEIETARAARLLGSQLANRVGLLDALKTAAEATRNSVIATALLDSHRAVQEGASLAASLESRSQIPKIARQLIAVGDAAGRLPEMLLHVARTLEADAQRTLDRLLALLTPALTLLIGGLIGLMVYSVMTAILSLNDIAVR